LRNAATTQPDELTSMSEVRRLAFFCLELARQRKGMGVRGLDDSGDAPLRVEQLAKMPGHARCVEDMRRR
jgi:hypothetical protein